MKALKLLVVLILFFACQDKKKEAIDKAIRERESNKGALLDSYSILRITDSLNILKVYYSVKLLPEAHSEGYKDSLILYQLADGVYEPQP